jgi:hypothetical protein
LKSAGFDFKIEIRPVKNQGKLMRKICRIMHDTSHKGEPFDSLAMAEEVRSNLDDIGLGKIHDWVAMRVTIVGYHGRNKSIKGAFQQNEESEMYSYAKRIVDAAFHRTCTEYGITLGEFKYYEFLEKLNGYSAGHWTFPYLNNRPFLTSEIQLNLSRWDILSRHGGAAHYLYIGGDRTIVENLGRAYHNLLYDVLGNTRGSTGTLKANKPDPGESSYKT